MSEPAATWLTVAVFVVTYAGLALGRLPGLRTDRPGIALAGAAGVLCLGLLGFEEAAKSVDWATLALLLGMMVVVASLRRAGFFEALAGKLLGRFSTPAGLLFAVMALSGVLSALLVNDVVCLALTPLAIGMARRLGLDPKPHLVGLAIASNVGSAATLTGNPQNMIIGSLSGIPYGRFAAKLAPAALACLLIAYALTWLAFRKTLAAPATPVEAGPVRRNRRPRRRLLVKSLVVTGAAVAGFFAGFPMPTVALGAAAVLLLDRVRPEAAYRQIDWGLLVMFAGLFVVVHAFEVHVLAKADVGAWPPLRESPVGLLSLISAALSNVVSNVPAVLLFKPVIPAMDAGVQETAWLALALSSTLAGNLTVLGSVANLIVVEGARKQGVAISLGDYCRAGVPVTLVTLAVGAAWLRFVPY